MFIAMNLSRLSNRRVLRLSGTDLFPFLQGLLTQDVTRMREGDAVFAAMLSPQGKLQAEMILWRQGNGLLLEGEAKQVEWLQKRLPIYRLRADVQIDALADWGVAVSAEPMEGGFADPRLAELGWRRIGLVNDLPEGDADYLTWRLQLAVPEAGDWQAERSFPMEMGIRELHGISDSKGCYIGQEIVARARNRGVLRKAIHQLQASGDLPEAGQPITQQGRLVGVMGSSKAGFGLGVVEYDAADKQVGMPLDCLGIQLSAKAPFWFPRAA